MNAIPATPFPQHDAMQNQVPGPIPGSRMTPEFVELIGRLAYLWAWPMVNVHNRLVAFDKLPEPGLVGGIVPAAPPNHLCMLTDYVVPEERVVACPNRDVVYGCRWHFCSESCLQRRSKSPTNYSRSRRYLRFCPPQACLYTFKSWHLPPAEFAKARAEMRP